MERTDFKLQRERLEREKQRLEELKKEREENKALSKNGKKTIKTFIGGAALACGLSVSILAGVFNLEADAYTLHKTTNVYTNEIVQEVEKDYSNSAYHKTRYVLYSPWKFDEFTGTYERSIKEFNYDHIDGEVTAEAVESNLTLVNSQIEKKDTIDKSESSTEPTLLVEEYVKENGMSEWKREYRNKCIGEAAIIGGIMCGLFSAGVIIGILGDGDFYGYRFHEKVLKAQELGTINRINGLEAKLNNSSGKSLKLKYKNSIL